MALRDLTIPLDDGSVSGILLVPEGAGEGSRLIIETAEEAPELLSIAL